MVKRCSRCSVDNRDDVGFCFRCGTKFTDVAEVPVTKPVTEAAAPPLGPSISRPPMIGMCSYHPQFPAAFTCTKCGKPICLNCTRAYLNMKLCSQCYMLLFPTTPPPTMFPGYYPDHTYGQHQSRLGI